MKDLSEVTERLNLAVTGAIANCANEDDLAALAEKIEGLQNARAAVDENQSADWLKATPHVSYALCADYNGEVTQGIDLTMEEFDALKDRLAKLRGYKLKVAA